MRPAVVRTFVDEREARIAKRVESFLGPFEALDRERLRPVSELCRWFGTSTAGAYRLIAEGTVRAVRLPNGSLRVSLRAIAGAIAEGEERNNG